MSPWRAGRPSPLGVTYDGAGCNVAVFSEAATKLELCLFDRTGRERRRLALPEKSGAVWHGYLPELRPGDRYGLRASGPYAPEAGHRFNANKLLLDPYAKAVEGALRLDDAQLGYDQGDEAQDLSFSDLDSADTMPKCLVAAPPTKVAEAEYPRRPWSETIIYEAHVKGLTQLWPDLPDGLRGTYDALGSEPVIDHLKRLGITAVELLPVHGLASERRLLDLGLSNYWGYNSIQFFVPEARYVGPSGPAGFREMVRRLHQAGIEVILDVVYNHTAEGDQRGPTLSFRGLDNAAYYRLEAGNRRYYVNDSGCGNCLDLAHPYMLRLVLDSLRWWVEVMGVDGFRFDLATALGREASGFDPGAGLFDALRQDPVLAQTKLIAEPWDLGPGGYRLGQFPPEFAEWNDGFRDSARRFWRGDPHAAQEMGDRLLGSAGHFDHAGRRPWASINFVTCHDGFTLADLTSYREKHNEANGEANGDGHNENYADNCGVEGPSDEAAVLARRRQRRRNLLATLLLAQGTPMLLAGDEVANSQQGNNNAYCQDNEIGWIDWSAGDPALLAFARRVIALRKVHPSLRQAHYLHGRARESDGQPDVAWLNLEGGPVNWRDPGLSAFGLLLREARATPAHARLNDQSYLVFNGGEETARLVLPPAPSGRHWVRALDSGAPAEPSVPCTEGQEQDIAGQTLLVFTLEARA